MASLFVALCFTRQGHAATTVLVVMRATDKVDIAPYELRLRSELSTEGVEAVVVNAAPTSTLQDSKQLAHRFKASFALDVSLSTTFAWVTVWGAEPGQPIEMVRSVEMSLEERDNVAVLALRAVDLFRGARLELEQQIRAKSATTTALASQPAVPNDNGSATDSSKSTAVLAPSKPNSGKASDVVEPSESGADKSKGTARPTISLAEPVPDATPSWYRDKEFVRRFRMGGGVSIMQFTDRLPRRIAPTISASVWLRNRLGLSITAAAPYVSTLIYLSTSSTGGVENNRVVIDQEFLWLDGRYRIRLSRTLDFEPILALGVARYGVVGRGAGTLVGRRTAAFSFLMGAGGAFGYRIARHFQLMTEVSLQAKLQTPHVIIDGTDETGTSKVNVWGAIGPAWSF